MMVDVSAKRKRKRDKKLKIITPEIFESASKKKRDEELPVTNKSKKLEESVAETSSKKNKKRARRRRRIKNKKNEELMIKSPAITKPSTQLSITYDSPSSDSEYDDAMEAFIKIGDAIYADEYSDPSSEEENNSQKRDACKRLSCSDMTVIIKGLNTSIEENDLKNHFVECGEILLITIIKDRGYAYMTFLHPEASKKALALNQSKLAGTYLTVEREPPIELLLSKKNEPETASTPQSCGSNTIRVCNLNPTTKESDIRKLFNFAENIPKITFEGTARVEFDSEAAAQKALKMNQKKLNGYPVKLELDVTSHIKPKGKKEKSFKGKEKV